MSFKLDKKQEELKVRIAERENGKNHGGIITTTTATNDLRIRQVLIEHILPQANRTLIIGSPSWINKFKEPLENIKKSLQSSAIFFNDSRRSPKLASLAGKDIVLINYCLLETIKSWSVTWERIIFHDFPDKNDKNDEQFQELCQLEATFRWCLTKNHKKSRLVEFLITDDDKRKNFMENIDAFLEQANLYLPSAEPPRELRTPLNDHQKDFKKSLAQREKEPLCGGIVTTLIWDILIKETIIAFLLDQKNTSEKYGHSMGKTLLVVPPDVIESWKELFEKLVKKDDLSVNYFDGNEKKLPDNRHEVIVTTYDMFETIENQNISWKRIIFHDSYLVSKKDNQQYQLLCQLHSEYRWCLTENPTQQSLACFMNRKKYEENYRWMENLTPENVGHEEKKQIAILKKDIEEILEKLQLRFPKNADDYLHFMTEAENASKNYSFDVCKFCSNLWAAIACYTEGYYYTKFKICAESDEDIEEMYDSFCAGLQDPSHVGLIMKVRVDAHWNFSKSEQDRCFIGKKAMDSIIENFEEAIEIIEKATQTSIEESYNESKDARSGKRPIEEVKASKA